VTQPPRQDRIEIDGGEPNGFVVVVLDRDVDPDPTRDLAAVLRGAVGAERLLAVLAALGNPPTRRLVEPASRAAVVALQARARRNDAAPPRDLTRFWRIDLQNRDLDPRDVARRLVGLPGVDLAYAESRVVSALSASVDTSPPDTGPPDTGATPPTAPRTTMLSQGYLEHAPKGVGAVDVGTRLGGQGQDVRFGDIEMGWVLGHPAYSAHAPGVVSPHPLDNRDGLDGFVGEHGTAVLGIVAASGPGVRVAGVAPRVAKVVCSSHYDAALRQELHVALAIAHAAVDLRAGDVLLLEVQRPGENGGGLLPTEIDPADFTAIVAATGAGIVVVEAAGNGTRDLDLWRHPTDGPLRAMRRDGPGDSRAIVVGSCVPAVLAGGHARFPDSNWGVRVDCYAWGQSVATAFAPPAVGDYTTTFNGTSAASAIVAGVAVAAQGMQRGAHAGATLDPVAMRDLLKGQGSTPQKPDTDQRKIGRMPSLPAIADQLGAVECPDDGDGDDV
jgi:hypothetical protein